MSRNGDYDIVRDRKRSGSPSPQLAKSGCCGGFNDESNPSETDDEKPRRCTDIFYLIVYVIFSLLMIVIAIFAICYGSPLRLINGMDSYGNICGMRNDENAYNVNMTVMEMDMTLKPYVFFFDIKNMDESTKICVEECPDKKILNYTDLQEFYRRTSVSLCMYDYNLDNLQNDSQPGPNAFVETLCPPLPVNESIALLKRCIPKLDGMASKTAKDQLIKKIFEYLNHLGIFKQVLGDLAVTWTSVLGLTIVSFVISFLILCCVHWMTSITSYIIFGATSLLSVAFTGILWWTYVDLTSMLSSVPEDERLEESTRNQQAFLTYSIISTMFTIILHLIMLYLRNRVTIVVQLFKEAGRVLRAMPCLFFQPLITFIALTSFFFVWLLVVLCLATADYQRPRNLPVLESIDETTSAYITTEGHEYEDHLNHNIPMPGISTNRTIWSNDIAGRTVLEYSDWVWVKYLWWIYLIGLIWCSEFILGCQQMVIASSVSTWYFSRDRPSLKWVITQSVRRLVKYHLGSVALGSFVITVVKIPRLILNFTQRILRKWDQYTCVKLVNKMCMFCLCSFDGWLKYIHHNAYTVIAIQCINFCPASRLACTALVGNALQISVINSIGDFVLFLAKCTIAALTGLIAIIMFRTDDTLYFYAIPVLMTVVFAYFVAHSVISVFEMAVDTLFLCFCEDHNMNSESQNFYAPSSLLQYMREDAPHVVAMGRNYDEAGPIPIKHGFEEAATQEEIYPMNIIHNHA